MAELKQKDNQSQQFREQMQYMLQSEKN